MASGIWTKSFWQSTFERSLGTFCQTLAGGYIVGEALTSADTVKMALLTATAAAILTVLKCIASATLTDGNPSIGSSEVLAIPGAKAEPVGEEPVEVVAEDAPVHPKRTLEE